MNRNTDDQRNSGVESYVKNTNNNENNNDIDNEIFDEVMAIANAFRKAHVSHCTVPSLALTGFFTEAGDVLQRSIARIKVENF